MLARHAEALFWAGRYLERAESAARFLDVTYHGQLQAMPWETTRAWSDVLQALGLSAAYGETGGPPTAATVSEFVVLDGRNPSSIVASVERARENLRSVRELVPTELWEAINAFHLGLRDRELAPEIESQPHMLYEHVKRQCQTMAGVAAETMARDEGWWFLQLGWMLERAEMSCRLLDVRYGQLVSRDGGGFHQWQVTLKSAAGSEAFRRTYRGSGDPADIVEFLLVSETFPRSVFFCMRTAEQALRRLRPRGGRTRPERLLGHARADLEFLDLHELLDGDLHAFLTSVQHNVRQVAEAVSLEFFRNSEELQLHSLDPDRRC